jgi:2-iminobutanoate/2-iminopropanoate deaminase
MAVTKIDPEGAVRFPHFSQAVLVQAPGPTLYVAGQGDLTGDFETQARCAWGRIDVLLTEAGMSRADIVKVTGYVVSRDHVPAYRAVFLDVMGDIRPASTLVVCDLVHPAMLVEIEVLAVRTATK